MTQQWRMTLVRGALVLMETMWIYALVAFLVALSVGVGKPSFLGTLCIVGGSFTISRFLQGTDLSLGILRIWGAALSILVFYAVLRIDFYGDWRLWDFGWADVFFNSSEATIRRDSAPFIAVPLLLVVWVRGVLRGQESLMFEDVIGSFAIGVAVVACVEVFGTFVDDLPRGVELIAVPYVAVGLLAIGLTHAARATDGVDREALPAWLLAIGGAVAALMVFSLLFVLIDFSTAQKGLEYTAYGIGWVFAGIFYIAAWPVVKIVEGIFWFIQWLADLGASPEPVPPLDTGEQQTDPFAPRDSILPGWVADVIRFLSAGAVIVALIIGLALLFTRYRRRTEPGELKESVYNEGRLASDLGDLLGSMFGRFRPRGGPGRIAEPVRRLYFEMLAAAEARGVERKPVDTPLEISPRLETTFASGTPGEITGLFDDVRYGAHEPPDADVRRLRDDWERLQGRT
ncbi:MAG TPA: DUF4129 domain-containing protein [Dehalococcoidia bacterium]|nr:DUF4129 domain-containing protein [Dehalococcoidia bacterium]